MRGKMKKFIEILKQMGWVERIMVLGLIPMFGVPFYYSGFGFLEIVAGSLLIAAMIGGVVFVIAKLLQNVR